MQEVLSQTKNIYILFSLLTLAVSFASGYAVFSLFGTSFSPNRHGETLAAESVIVERPSVFEMDIKPIYEDPVKLKIDSAKINLEIIRVGVEESGQLENPKDWNVGGWFSKSAKAGEPGNLIINAHYDNNYGQPAAFWQLKSVNVNDKVLLVDSLGRTYTYVVTESFYIEIDDPDRLRIFDSSKDVAEVTLITCGGVWDYGAGTYNKRLVVKGRLEEQKL